MRYSANTKPANSKNGRHIQIKINARPATNTKISVKIPRTMKTLRKIIPIPLDIMLLNTKASIHLITSHAFP